MVLVMAIPMDTLVVLTFMVMPMVVVACDGHSDRQVM